LGGDRQRDTESFYHKDRQQCMDLRKANLYIVYRARIRYSCNIPVEVLEAMEQQGLQQKFYINLDNDITRNDEIYLIIVRKQIVLFYISYFFTSCAFYVSVACKVLRTEADTSMRCSFTLRVETALSCQTGVYAFSIQALLMIRAILIQMTLYIA